MIFSLDAFKNPKSKGENFDSNLHVSGVPSQVIGFSLTTPYTIGNITMEWSANPQLENISYYKIYRNGTHIANSTSLYYTDSNIIVGNFGVGYSNDPDPGYLLPEIVLYIYQVSAVNDTGGEGPGSRYMFLMITPYPPPIDWGAITIIIIIVVSIIVLSIMGIVLIVKKKRKHEPSKVISLSSKEIKQEQGCFYASIVSIIMTVIGLFFAGMILGGGAIGGSAYALIKGKTTKTRILALIGFVLGLFDFIVTLITVIIIL